MGYRSRVKRLGRVKTFCQRCRMPIPQWPNGGAIVENCNGTESMKLCLTCVDYVLNLKGVQVIKDNVNRG